MWTATGSMSTARDGHRATLLPSGKVLVTGGYGVNTAEVYDPANGTWARSPDMSIARFDHTATLLPSGKVLVTGGFDGYRYLYTAEVYDPESGRWARTSNLSAK